MNTPRRILPQRILIIPLRFIGDTVVSVPLIRNLRHYFPDAQIDVLASAVTAPLLTPCPDVGHVLVEPKGLWRLGRLLRERDYDCVILLRKSVSLALLCQAVGVPTVIGYDKQRFPWGYRRWGWGLDYQTPYPGLRTETPQALSHLAMLSHFGCQPVDTHLSLWTTPEDEAAVDRLLAETSLADTARLAVVHITSASHGKTLPAGRFAESVGQLLAQGFSVIFTGIASDRPQYDALMAEYPALAACHNWAGRTSLRETVALLSRAQLLLTVDSGPVHLGLAVGVPEIVAVYGPTNERQWGWYPGCNPKPIRFRAVFKPLDCRPCYAKVCSHNACKTTLESEAIRAALPS